MIVLVTGATSGIGKQLALDYLAEGHSVYCCGRNESALAELTRDYPELAHAVVFDIQDRSSCANALDQLPTIDVAVLNAGTCEYIDARNFDAESFQRVFDINVVGTGNCLQYVIPRMASDGVLALMGSSSSFLPLPRAEAYGASKAAIEYLAKTLAITLKPAGIHVTYVAPGFVETPLTDLNDFPMPMRVDVNYASRHIRQGINRRRRVIHFPRLFTGALRLLGRLPLGLQQRLVARTVSR